MPSVGKEVEQEGLPYIDGGIWSTTILQHSLLVSLKVKQDRLF